MGHTHEDIDQLFSKISDEIKRIGCECIPGEEIEVQFTSGVLMLTVSSHLIKETLKIMLCTSSMFPLTSDLRIECFIV